MFGEPDTCLRDADGFCRLARAGNKPCFAGPNHQPSDWCHDTDADGKHDRLFDLCKAKGDAARAARLKNQGEKAA